MIPIVFWTDPYGTPSIFTKSNVYLGAVFKSPKEGESLPWCVRGPERQILASFATEEEAWDYLKAYHGVTKR